MFDYWDIGHGVVSTWTKTSTRTEIINLTTLSKALHCAANLRRFPVNRITH